MVRIRVGMRRKLQNGRTLVVNCLKYVESSSAMRLSDVSSIVSKLASSGWANVKRFKVFFAFTFEIFGVEVISPESKWIMV